MYELNNCIFKVAFKVYINIITNPRILDSPHFKCSAKVGMIYNASTWFTSCSVENIS